MPSPRPNLLLAMVAEFRRACAAAQRYEDLRYRSAGRSAPAAIPRRVFEELYSSEKAAEVGPVVEAAAPEVALPPSHQRPLRDHASAAAAGGLPQPWPVAPAAATWLADSALRNLGPVRRGRPRRSASDRP
jgi:hypothetical protein